MTCQLMYGNIGDSNEFDISTPANTHRRETRWLSVLEGNIIILEMRYNLVNKIFGEFRHMR